MLILILNAKLNGLTPNIKLPNPFKKNIKLPNVN